MAFIKNYLVWIILALVVAILLAVQIVAVGGMRREAAEKHAEVLDVFDDLQSTARTIHNVPTREDLRVYGGHLNTIQQEGTEVQKLWREVTGGLNAWMKRTEENGRTVAHILHPYEEGHPPVVWSGFTQFIYYEYINLLKGSETVFAKRLRPYLQQELAMERYARDPRLDMDMALQQAENEVGLAAVRRAHIWQASQIIPFQIDKQFEREEAIAEWRAFLIAKDVLRTLVETRAEATRTLYAKERLTEEIEDEDARLEAMAELGTTVLQTPCWYFVDRLDALEVEGPDPGNAELPAFDEEGNPIPGTGGVTVRKAPEESPRGRRGRRGGGPEEEEKEETRYHDIFTVSIQMQAHLTAIQQFMRQLLRSENVFYVPVSMKIDRYEDAAVMDVVSASETEEEVLALDGGYDLRKPPRPIDTTARFGHEPPVKVELVYQVYRFRYADTVNPSSNRETTR